MPLTDERSYGGCKCGGPAVYKVAEEITSGDHRHPLTMYLCRGCFKALMGSEPPPPGSMPHPLGEVDPTPEPDCAQWRERAEARGKALAELLTREQRNQWGRQWSKWGEDVQKAQVGYGCAELAHGLGIDAMLLTEDPQVLAQVASILEGVKARLAQRVDPALLQDPQEGDPPCPSST